MRLFFTREHFSVCKIIIQSTLFCVTDDKLKLMRNSTAALVTTTDGYGTGLRMVHRSGVQRTST